MRTIKNDIICIICVLALAGVGALGSEQPGSATQVASCVAKITVAPVIMPLNRSTTKSLVVSSGVAGKAGREALGELDSDIAAEVLEGIEITQLADGPSQSVTIRLSVQLPDGVKPAAEEFLNAMVRNLRDDLRAGAYDSYVKELTILVGQAGERYEYAIAELNVLLDNGTDASLGQEDIDDLAVQRRDLTRNIQNLQMDLASMNARREAIERQVARTREELHQTQARDEITLELTKILQNNEELLGTLEKQVQVGQLPMSELAAAKERVIQARIELAQRREEMVQSAGGRRLNEYNAALSEMSIDAAEARVRLTMLEQRLEETEVQLRQASKFTRQTSQIRMARQAVNIAEDRVIELKRRLAELDPPIVTVIGAGVD